jgi:MSHA biogenesis protein MshK
MDERLSAARLLCVLTVVAASTAAGAQASLPDPTLPPAAGPVDGASKAPVGRTTNLGHRLQSVLISPERKLAVIDGRTVPLGGQIDGARIVEITEDGVTLRRGTQTETLPLHAGVRIKQVAP